MSEFVCPWCGDAEPNRFLLQNNHWVKPPDHIGFDWCHHHGMCIAMSLTRSHVLYAASRLTNPNPGDDLGCCHRHRKASRDCLREQLRRYVARAAQVWPLPRRAWLSEYESLATDPTPPEHHQVPDSEQADLLAVMTG